MPTFVRVLLFIVGTLLALFGGGCLILAGSLGGTGSGEIEVYFGVLPLLVGGIMVIAALRQGNRRREGDE